MRYEFHGRLVDGLSNVSRRFIGKVFVSKRKPFKLNNVNFARLVPMKGQTEDRHTINIISYSARIHYLYIYSAA